MQRLINSALGTAPQMIRFLLPSLSKFHAPLRSTSQRLCSNGRGNEMRAMTEEAARHLIRQVPEWNLVNENGRLKLHRSWKVKTFMRGIEFFQHVAALAETEGHHPDLHLVGWNNVKIDIWTHTVGGLTENDFILAAKINKLNLYPLLRIEASNE